MIFFALILPSIFISSWAMYEMICRLVHLPAEHFLRRNFYIKAGKSSEALLIGGLPLAISFMTTVLYQIRFSSTPSIDQAYLISSCLVIFYGYVDDRCELRSLVKFSAQILVSLIFSLSVANGLAVEQSSFAFILIFVVALGVMNGANLLDGLDSMSVKVAVAVLSIYAVISYFLGMTDLMYIISGFAVGLLAFHLYNKHPARIHLGEIGGAALGLGFLYLSCKIFKANFNSGSVYLELIAQALLPMTIYGVEVATTFFRRVISKKSPFVGDQLHVHHLLKNIKGFSISPTVNLITLFYSFLMVGSLILVKFTFLSYTTVALLSTFLLTAAYFSLGSRYWFKGVKARILLKDFFSSLKKEEIVFIDSSASSRFEVKIYSTPSEEINDDCEVPDEDAA